MATKTILRHTTVYKIIHKMTVDLLFMLNVDGIVDIPSEILRYKARS